MATRRILGFPHRPQPHGGPGSFQLRLTAALEDRGVEIVYPDSGVLPDVVMVLPDSWKLEVPDLEALEPAAVSILEHYDDYSRSARKRAEEVFDIDRMVEKYLEVLVS